MTLLQNYLSDAKVKKTLKRRPGEEGFSLIELVVVVAVLAILSAVAIPQFTNISSKARAAAASNTVATIAKECAAKIADQGAGASSTFNPPISMSGYKDSAGGWYTGGTSLTAKGTKATSTTAIQCPTANNIGLVSEDTSQYPDFFYNVGTGAKTCTASGDAVARGCVNSSW